MIVSRKKEEEEEENEPERLYTSQKNDIGHLVVHIRDVSIGRPRESERKYGMCSSVILIMCCTTIRERQSKKKKKKMGVFSG